MENIKNEMLQNMQDALNNGFEKQKFAIVEKNKQLIVALVDTDGNIQETKNKVGFKCSDFNKGVKLVAKNNDDYEDDISDFFEQFGDSMWLQATSLYLGVPKEDIANELYNSSDLASYMSYDYRYNISIGGIVNEYLNLTIWENDNIRQFLDETGKNANIVIEFELDTIQSNLTINDVLTKVIVQKDKKDKTFELEPIEFTQFNPTDFAEALETKLQELSEKPEFKKEWKQTSGLTI